MLPTLTTSLMMKRLIEGENLMISGGWGIGKTYTFLIYEHLSKFMIKCRLDEFQ